MPLKSGKKVMGDNIKEWQSTGKYKPTQTIAIALDVARQSEPKKKRK